MIEIIPAIDLIDGKCVRLEQGDYRMKKVYSADPLDIAKTYEDAGIQRLHMVDLDGAKAKKVINWKTLEKITAKTGLVVDFGGGIKTDKDLEIVFSSGAEMAVIGSVAVTEPALMHEWLMNFGAEKLILGADVKNKQIAISAWEEITQIDLFSFIEDYSKMGVHKILCTDISKDGMLHGPSIELYREIKEKFTGLWLIASGGVSSVMDIEKLNEDGIPAVIIGKAIYEGKIKINELKKFT